MMEIWLRRALFLTMGMNMAHCPYLRRENAIRAICLRRGDETI